MSSVFRRPLAVKLPRWSVRLFFATAFLALAIWGAYAFATFWEHAMAEHYKHGYEDGTVQARAVLDARQAELLADPEWTCVWYKPGRPLDEMERTIP